MFSNTRCFLYDIFFDFKRRHHAIFGFTTEQVFFLCSDIQTRKVLKEQFVTQIFQIDYSDVRLLMECLNFLRKNFV